MRAALLLLLPLLACGDGAKLDVGAPEGGPPADAAPADTASPDTAPTDSGAPCDVAVWYVDADGDGYGDAATGVEACAPDAGRVADGTDCDDADATVNPGAQEVCGDGDDDDCDGNRDVASVAETWHPDADGDGYGHMYDGASTCDPPAGWVLDATDCRPSDPEAHPGAAERCNEDDDDCDREVDEGMDADGDGHRNDACADGDDCDDADPTAHPGVPEDACEDGVDQDCDGADRPCDFLGEHLLADAAKLHAPSASEDAGRLLDVGDATGDGVPDLFVATYAADAYAGGGYLVPGPLTGSASMGTVGHHLAGDATVMKGAGRSIGVGDVDGDGIADLAFGAPYMATCGMYVLLGPIAADAGLEDADHFLLGAPATYAGHGGDLGDVTGDGVADAVIGAYADDSGGESSGIVYVVHGPFDAEMDLDTQADAAIAGEASGDKTGRHVHVGGDYDGDGIGDFLAAAPDASGGAPTSGIVYVVYGPGSIADMSAADGRLLGETPDAHLGHGAAMSAGDVDGDGLDDVAVGASGDSTAGSGTGSAYVVFGPALGDTSVSAADVIVRGDAATTSAGSGVGLGDVGGDGLLDLLVGASGGAGGAYLFLAPAPGTYTPSDADAWFLGEAATDSAGTSVAIEDVTGDGTPEVLVGAPAESTGGVDAGAVYVAFPAL